MLEAALVSLALLVPLAELPAPTGVAAYGGFAVWSQGKAFDAYGHSPGGFRLVASVAGGAPAALPVRPRAIPFDASVGPDEHGRPTVVYSRCKHEPADFDGGFFSGSLLGTNPYAAARGCDVYRYDVARQRETRVKAASDLRESEFMPSVWRDRIAFARGRNVYVSTAGHAARAVAGADRGEPIGLAIYGRHVAVVRRREASCRRADHHEPYDDETSELWLTGTVGHARRIARSCTTERTLNLASPSFLAGRVYFLAHEEAGAQLRSRSLRGGSTTSIAAPDCVGEMVAASDGIYSARMATCPSPEPGDPLRYEVARTVP
jgi:hypothetical protein